MLLEFLAQPPPRLIPHSQTLFSNYSSYSYFYSSSGALFVHYFRAELLRNHSEYRIEGMVLFSHISLGIKSIF